MGEIQLRAPRPEDQAELGRILYAAFADIAAKHGFRPDFPSREIATGVIGFVSQTAWGVVAERDGRLLGSNFLREDDPAAGVGPVSVDPELQESGIGRLLMRAVIERAERRGAHSVRLVQDAFNATSMALYAGLGFEVREPLVLLEGKPRSGPPGDVVVRELREEDLGACARLCEAQHGITRSEELRATLGRIGPWVALREGEVTAYASSLTFWAGAHGVAASEADLQALLLGGAAASDGPLAFLLPTRQAPLFRWALCEGLRIAKPMTLMTRGPYQEPEASWFPSVLY